MTTHVAIPIEASTTTITTGSPFRVQPCDLLSQNVAEENPKEQLTSLVGLNSIASFSASNNQTLGFFGGQVKNCLPQWKLITQDPVILNAIQHYNIEFEDEPPLQTLLPTYPKFSQKDK